MLNRAVLITGASRGLGLEFVKQLSDEAQQEHSSNQKPAKVIATCRNPQQAADLQAVAKKREQVVIVKKLDVTDFPSFTNFVAELRPLVESVGGISCLINNAGVSPKSTKYTMVTAEQMDTTFETNATAPLLLAREMLPLLKFAIEKGHQASVESNDQTMPLCPSLIVNMSSILGSVALNHPQMAAVTTAGGIYPYRASKCALNMISRSLSIDLLPTNIRVVAVHPGWVKTDLGGKRAPLTPAESIKGIIDNVLNNFNSEKYNGNLVDYQGKVLPF